MFLNDDLSPASCIITVARRYPVIVDPDVPNPEILSAIAATIAAAFISTSTAVCGRGCGSRRWCGTLAGGRVYRASVGAVLHDANAAVAEVVVFTLRASSIALSPGKLRIVGRVPPVQAHPHSAVALPNGP